MSIRVIALQNFDNVLMGQEVDLAPEYGKAVIQSGLAAPVEPDQSTAAADAAGEAARKAAATPANKAAPETSNKAQSTTNARGARAASGQQ